MKNTLELINELLNCGKILGFEMFSDARSEYIYYPINIDYNKGSLWVRGESVIHEIELNSDFSLDENLQSLYELVSFEHENLEV